MPAEIPDGAVVVARSIVNSSLWTMRPADRVVAITCITLCNRKPRKWFDGHKDVLIERGQFVRSREKLVEACKLPLQVVRTSIEHLERTDFLTRKSTRDYTLYTVPKYDHYQDLTKYSDSAVENLTQDSTRAQPQTTTTEETTPSIRTLKRGRPDGGTVGGVVVVQPGVWPDPLLAKPNFRIATTLLEGIQMKRSVASTLAMSRPLGLVLRVVQQARLQRNPGGWAKIALENDWWLPEATGDELREIIQLVTREVESANASLLTATGMVSQKLPRMPGESERDWLKRNMENLKSKPAKSRAR